MGGAPRLDELLQGHDVATAVGLDDGRADDGAHDDGAHDEVDERSGFRHVPAAVLTTLIGAGLAVTLMTGAWARPADSGAAGLAGADVAATATQQYRAPGGFALTTTKRERFAAAAAPTIAPTDGSDDPSDSPSGAPSDAPAPALPSGKVAPAGEAQAYAAKLIAARGWKPQEFACLAQLWGRESGWNAHAGRTNGPYGIPQAYPGSKMAAAGGDWVNDHRVQIRWGLGYVAGRYGTPCKAWTHWQGAHSY